MSERRELVRAPTFLGGHIEHRRLPSSTVCLVRNLSEFGAKVVFAGPVTIPDLFELTIDKTGLCRRSRIVWCRAMEAGVSFREIEATVPDPFEATLGREALAAYRASSLARIAQPRIHRPASVISLDLYRERVRGLRMAGP